MMEKLKLKYRMLAVALLPVLITAAAFTVIYVNAQQVREMETLVSNRYDMMKSMAQMKASFFGIQRATRATMLVRDDRTLQVFNSMEKSYNNYLRHLNGKVADPQQIQILKEISGLTEITINDERALVMLVNEGKRDVAIERFRTSDPITNVLKIDGLIQQFQQKENELMIEVKNESEHATSVLIASIWLGISITILLAVASGLWISFRTSRKIESIINVLSSTTTEIAATVTEHERTATQQAAMINETTTTIDELGVSSRQSAEQSEAAVDSVQKALALTGEGNDTVGATIGEVEGLKNRVGDIAEKILDLGEQMGQIGTLADLVKDLSGQINMLSLNAAVEAARAGEYGKGFAVVASEIRKLAVESKKSAEESRQIVQDIQKSTNSVIMTTEEGSKKVEEVTAIVQKLGELFSSLTEAATIVNSNSQQAMLNARQQSVAIKQMLEATGSINTGARETAAGISQTKIGIQNLDDAAQILKAMI
jgi:methyl-accepting chemotaxis protein